MQPYKYNPPKLHSGQFRHRVTFREVKIFVDDIGNQREQIDDIGTFWSAIKTMKGNEFYDAATSGHENTYRFIIHYAKGLSPSMEIKYDGRIFDIESLLNDDEANKTITVIAKERV